MNTTQLCRAIKNDKIAKKNFRGIFPSDKIPNPCSLGFYIVNLDTSTEPGSHWICLKIGKFQNEFFDSYGFAPKLNVFKKRLGKNYIFNTKKLQHEFSTTCGQWCLFYIFFASRGKQMKEIFSQFSSRHKYANDVHVKNFVSQKLKTKTEIINSDFLLDQIARSVSHNMFSCHYYCKKRKR